MATLRTLQRQPDKLDYASPTQFRWQINQLPLVEFFNVAANLPGISMSPTIQPTTLGRDIPIHGDKIAFEELSINFVVDEYLENYITLHNWLLAIGFPESRSQFKDWKTESSTANAAATTAQSLYSDAVLTILSNKNNPIVQVMFKDVFPLTLSGIDYTQEATDVEYVTASATFAYQLYEIETL